MDIDDKPVGQSNANDVFKEEMERLAREEASQGNDDGKPLEERLVSKNANTRTAAFQQLEELISSADCAIGTLSEHADKWTEYLADGSITSLEAALKCFLAFLNKAPNGTVSQFQPTVLKILVEKCMTNSRPSIKDQALECAI